MASCLCPSETLRVCSLWREYKLTTIHDPMTGTWREGRNLLLANDARKDCKFLAHLFATPKDLHVRIELLVGRYMVADGLSRSNELPNAFLNSLRFQLRLRVPQDNILQGR